MSIACTKAMIDVLFESAEPEDRHERLMKEGRVHEALLVLFEDGQTGYAFYVASQTDPEAMTGHQRHDVIRRFAEDVDVEHAKRLSSRWRISATLPPDILKMFRLERRR